MAREKSWFLAGLLLLLLGVLIVFSFLALFHGGPARTWSWLAKILADWRKIR
ncbi:MAG: hypothetical protein GX493_08840 [Firmicutes bacterium]|nr:hypothetical protein [Bacillota bacterium]